MIEHERSDGQMVVCILSRALAITHACMLVACTLTPTLHPLHRCPCNLLILGSEQKTGGRE
jgi:hypothetical protein